MLQKVIFFLAHQDKFLEFCVAGKEYMSKSGYVNYDLHLPKASNGKYAFGGVEEGKVIIYEEDKHLKKLETKNVESFGDELSLNGTATAEDFNLD